MQKFTIGKNEAGQRFDKFLAKYLPSAPKSLIYKMLRKKNITLNGKKADGSEILSLSDSVESFFSDETFSKFSEGNNSIINSGNNFTASSDKLKLTSSDILYEDDDILLIDKHPGILSQKAENSDYSLNEWLIDYMLNNNSLNEQQLKTFKPSVCNRLDRNTGGLVICGKSLLGLQTMTELIRSKDIEKHYITLCNGHFSQEGRIEAYISKDEKTNKSTVKNITDKKSSLINGSSGRDLSDGASIITEFKVIKTYKSATLLDVNLLTGKSHQIRAQLSALGNPIIGDKKYGSSDKYGAKYQLLYAYKLIFPSADKLPDGMKHLGDKVFELPMPEYFNRVIEKL